ncbi:MAG: tetratricopeptide repeat protein [Blastocatellia bacterium]|nr:tetratricopeptide repeat protein [Blastocatellia bacterium]
MTLKPGTLIAGRYEVVNSFAGGMGIVYLCADQSYDGHPVALKTFKPEYLSNRMAREQFLREVTAWIQLGSHPNLVRAYQVLHVNDGMEVYAVVQFVAGEEGARDASLRSPLLSGRPFPMTQTLFYALQIARGMRYANAKLPGLVHRDLKPENILVDRDGIVRITDFGLVSTQKENPHGVVGTPNYMPPEQWQGGPVDCRADIYAFGCIVYEMMTGHYILEACQGDVQLIAASHLQGLPQMVAAQALEALPDLIKNFVRICLFPNPAERPPNWSFLCDTLEYLYYTTAGQFPPVEPTPDTASVFERKLMGWSLNAIGLSYLDIGKIQNSLGFFQKSLNLAHELNDRQLLAASLGNAGLAQKNLGNMQAAVDLLQKSLQVKAEIGDRLGEVNSLVNLGGVFETLGQVEQALGFYHKAMLMARELKLKRQEATAINQIANLYFQIGKTEQSIEFGVVSLELFIEINDRRGMAVTMGSLGQRYRKLGEAEKALLFSQKALQIFREIGDRYAEGRELSFQGYTNYALKQMSAAVTCWQASLTVAEEVGDRMLIASNSYMLAQMAIPPGMLDLALQLAEKAARLYTEVGKTDWAQDALDLVQKIKELKK